MEFRLTIVSTPGKELAGTNEVYVNPSDPAAQVKELEIDAMVFTCRPHPAVPSGAIALNAVQRRTIKRSGNEAVVVRQYSAPAGSNDAVMVHAELAMLGKSAIVAKGSEVQAADLVQHVTRCFGNQMVTENQAIIMEFMGSNYLLSISQVMVKDKTGTLASGLRGRLVPATAFVFNAASGSGITVGGQRNIAAPKLFKAEQLDFVSLGIGGLDKQFEEIFRRAFSSRTVPPDLLERMGQRHVKGMLLYGPPGTGKTLIARQIGKRLNGREPKVVNGPEVLNKYVGASEENIRKLFADAEAEQAARGDASELHVIIFDEIDAICKSRGSVQSGTGVNDSIVNQLLTKIDGVDSLNNILLIGMTNRKDMLDEALLRPGRLEVQVEIGLADAHGRLQILKIHTAKMSDNHFLAHDVDLETLADMTKNFSGAEIEGLVNSARSFAFNREVDVRNLNKQINEDNLKVTMNDFMMALKEVKPAFGAVTETLNQYRLNDIINWGPGFVHLATTCKTLTEQTRNSARTPLLTALLEGPAGSGKTAIAATLGIDSQFPFVKVLSAENMVGWGEAAKAGQIAKVFEDSYKSPLSMVVLDDIERLLEYVGIGPRFSNVILQTLLVLLKKQPPEGRKLFIVGTTSSAGTMSDLGIMDAFNVNLHVPALKTDQIRTVFQKLGAFAPQELEMAVASLIEPEMPIKRLLLLLEMARQAAPNSQTIPVQHWAQVLRDLSG